VEGFADLLEEGGRYADETLFFTFAQDADLDGSAELFGLVDPGADHFRYSAACRIHKLYKGALTIGSAAKQ